MQIIPTDLYDIFIGGLKHYLIEQNPSDYNQTGLIMDQDLLHRTGER